MVLFFWTTLASVSFKKWASCRRRKLFSIFFEKKKGYIIPPSDLPSPAFVLPKKMPGRGGEVLSFSLGSKNCQRLGEVTDLLLLFSDDWGGGGSVSPLPLRISYTVVEEEERFSLFDDGAGRGLFPPPFLYGARLRIVLPYFLRKSGGGGGIVLSF